MARRSISEVAKIVIAAVLLGPPLGGLVVMGLLQILPWIATDFSVPLPEFGKNLVSALALAVPLSYAVGGSSAILGGLALAAYVSWGGRLTWWSCLIAALIYPAVLAVSGWLATRGSPASVPPTMINAAMMALAAASAALLTFLLLRRTAMVRRLNAPPDA